MTPAIAIQEMEAALLLDWETNKATWTLEQITAGLTCLRTWEIARDVATIRDKMLKD